MNILRNKKVGPKGTESRNVVSGAPATFSGEQTEELNLGGGTVTAEAPGTGTANKLPILFNS